MELKRETCPVCGTKLLADIEIWGQEEDLLDAQRGVSIPQIHDFERNNPSVNVNIQLLYCPNDGIALVPLEADPINS